MRIFQGNGSVKSRGALLFDQSKRTEEKLRGTLSAQRYFACLGRLLIFAHRKAPHYALFRFMFPIQSYSEILIKIVFVWYLWI